MLSRHTLVWISVAVVALHVSKGVAAPAVFPGNGHVYEVVLDATSDWPEARAKAQLAGGDLATITSAAEQAFIKELLISEGAPTGSYWFGLRESATPNLFEPVSGTSSFSSFAPGEPNNGAVEEETVGGIYWTASAGDNGGRFLRRGEWNDLPATGFPDAVSGAPLETDLYRAGFIVEVDAAPSPVPIPAAVLIFPGTALVAFAAARRLRRAA
jgi:hypothetical protein